ncbi:ketopantoate reductase family protein [Streptococcus merionis]|uniref:ketopantoate reductase family protein n=1 Tax=Streptococcus merionis TaxID=400065 RepID=UPI0026F24D67|nr:2-dehydropantoate 2-reductase N-terminal domain-containing protein [Streptococcus merionis]
MKICILGLGVIGTTYGYVFQQAGHEVEHFVRPEKQEQVSGQLPVHLLDGRFDKSGREYDDTYKVSLAKPNSEYDFIFVSVRSGRVGSAITSLKEQNIKGTIVLFCNFWNTHEEVEEMVQDYPYVVGFPTAGGVMEENRLNGVIFDNVTLAKEIQANVLNYSDLLRVFEDAHIKVEIPYDMIEWIWIHMAVNAGVTSTAATLGDLGNPQKLASDLMDSSKYLSTAIKAIRETLRIVASRGVKLKKYRGEILPYKIPISISSRLMKYMFAHNELTRRIMTLHNDQADILYACNEVYHTGLENAVDMPVFQKNMEIISGKL